MEVTLAMLNGDVLIEGERISLNSDGEISPELRGFVKVPCQTNDSEEEFRSDQKFIAFNSVASLVICAKSGKITSVCILFDEIVFFDKSVLESKIVKRFEKKYGIKINGTSATIAEIGRFSWGEAFFSYDARQGDLNLCIFYNVV